jgi:hypothetical protein
LISLPAQAADTGPYAGLGMFFQNMLKVTESEKAARSLYGEVYLPELVAGYRFWNVFPTFGWTILGKKINDGEKRRYVMRIDLPYVFGYDSETELKAGFGMLFHRIRGDGQSVSLRNGSSTSTFYVPSGNRSSATFYLSAGLGLIRNAFRFDFDLVAGEPFSRRRSINFSMRGGYVF